MRREGGQENELFSGLDIVLTDDLELLDKLRRKVKEYGERVGFTAPEADPHGTYKRDILQRLLDRGNISAKELGEELKARYGSGFSVGAFNDAYGVIAKYNSKEFEGVRGGTGLK